jgi:hypothetical protein
MDGKGILDGLCTRKPDKKKQPEAPAAITSSNVKTVLLGEEEEGEKIERILGNNVKTVLLGDEEEGERILGNNVKTILVGEEWREGSNMRIGSDSNMRIGFYERIRPSDSW